MTVMVSSLDDLPITSKYLTRIGAQPRSLRTAVVVEAKGDYWQDLAVIKFDKFGEVDAKSIGKLKVIEEDGSLLPNSIEEPAIKAEFAGVRWPELKLLDRIVDTPPMVKEADPKDVFEFRNTDGKIVMLQVRTERKGERAYVPLTYWSDDQWRTCEPEGPLPLYNAHRLKDAATVFIHEGAKAARHCQWMVDGKTRQARDALVEHPWGQELSGAVHIGWIGGALSPHRTDWGAIAKSRVKQAYIVADNDAPGRQAIGRISFHLRMQVMSVEFTDDFPISFDLADTFPDKFFKKFGDRLGYSGPKFNECVGSATWATDLRPNKQGNPTPVLRDCFSEEWYYISDMDSFVSKQDPATLKRDKALNTQLASFSSAKDTVRLITSQYKGRTAKLCYFPDLDGFFATSCGKRAFNSYIKPKIKADVNATEKDMKQWEDFLEMLFPIEEERYQMKRWCATLISKPAVRMTIAILLISTKQGVGKTMLCQTILGGLVGSHNLSLPRGEEVSDSKFNPWAAYKRLAVINELDYKSAKAAYEKLKNIITEDEVTIERKYYDPETVENWVHIMITANRFRVLRLEADDRRFFVPQVTETGWSTEKYKEFAEWIHFGGLSVIKQWADTFRDYVEKGDPPMMTETKKRVLYESLNESEEGAATLAVSFKSMENPAALTYRSIKDWLVAKSQGRVYESPQSVRKIMEQHECIHFPRQVKIGNMLERVFLNPELDRLVDREIDTGRQNELIRKHLTTPASIDNAQI